MQPRELQVAPPSLIDELTAADIPFDLLPHVRTTTAVDEARALGLAPSEVAKTVVLGTRDGLVRVVLPASERLDLHKVRALLGDEDVWLASEEELAESYPEFEVGAVPPLAGGRHDPQVVDIRVCENDYAVVEAGTHEQSLRLATRDLIAREEARVADVYATAGP